MDALTRADSAMTARVAALAHSANTIAL
jgi:hypothetical protein